MTSQEVLWENKLVWVVSIKSRAGKLHRFVREYVGRGGLVIGEAKNGMLLVRFKRNHVRAIPAGCLEVYGEAIWVK